MKLSKKAKAKKAKIATRNKDIDNSLREIRNILGLNANDIEDVLGKISTKKVIYNLVKLNQ